MKKISFALLSILVYINLFCQERIIAGRLIDVCSMKPVYGASIIVQESGKGVISQVDGAFRVLVNEKDSSLLIALLGYQEKQIAITNQLSNLGNVLLTPTYFYLTDAMVVSQIGVPRKTPLAVSSVPSWDINERIGNQEFVELLKNTPGVHVNRQGGGWSDGEIHMRGFDNSNIAVMINGIPINDPENGTVYWSNWASLAGAASIIQSQRGIGGGIVASPSIGGTINIVTKGIENKKGGGISHTIGNDGFKKTTFHISTGIVNNGWSMAFQGGSSSGNGYFQGGEFKVKDIFFNASKRFGTSHQLSLIAFGSSQEHYSRIFALTESDWKRVKSLYTIKNHWTQYNPELGYNSHGKRCSTGLEHFSNGMAFITHTWQITPSSSLSSSAYYSFGKGYSHSGLADERTYSEYDWYASDNGKLNMKFRAIDGTFDYAKIEDINKSSMRGSLLVISNTIGNYGTYGLVSTYKNHFGEYYDLTTGLDFRYYKALHQNTLNDLLGGDYYIDPGRQDVSIDNNPMATNAWKQYHLGIGDILYRDYDSHIVQEGSFAQVELSKNSFNAFASVALNRSHYWRYDRFYYSSDKAESGITGFWGGNIKAGINYRLDERSNIYTNLGFVSKPPKFKGGAFMSATSSHTINKQVANEKALAAEIGYGFHNKSIDLALNGYYIEWIDKAMTKKGKIDGQYYLNMTGVNSVHTGIEFEVNIHPKSWMDLLGMLSIGDWRWSSDKVKGYAYNLSGKAITSDGELTMPGAENHAWALINMKGIHVGGSAQTTAYIGTEFMPFKNLKIGAGCTFFDRNYAYYSLSGNNLKIGKEVFVSEPWKAPADWYLDTRVVYTFKIASIDATLIGQVNNVLDNHYVEKSWNPSNVGTSTEEVNPEDVYMFYSLGRMWNMKLQLNF